MASKANKTMGRMLILLAACWTLAVAGRTQSPETATESAPTTATESVSTSQRIVGDIYVEAVGTAFQDRMTMGPLLGELEEMPFDEVLLRVRENGYAYYGSDLTPKPMDVSANFDPLAEALGSLRSTARAKKVIAWFSPYRIADVSGGKDTLFTEEHVMRSDLVKGKPGALLSSANQMVYLNPGDPAIQAHLEAVIADLAGRYEIDGILIDLELPAVVEEPARWEGFDWDAFAASVQGLVQAARKARPGLIICVADQGLGVSMGDSSVDFRNRWLSTAGIDRLYSNCYVDEKSGAGRFDAGVADAVRQAKAAGVTVYAGVAGERNEAVNALAQCKRAVAMGVEGIALSDFNRPVLDAGARKLFFNALKSAVLSDGGLRVSTRVDRSLLTEALAASGASALGADEALTTGATVLMTDGEDAETVFEMPPPPEAVGMEDQGISGVAPDLAVSAIQDEQTSPGVQSGDDLERALGNLTGIGGDADESSGEVPVIKSSQAILGDLLRDPQFEQKREWKLLTPEVQSREQLKEIFPNIF